MRQQTMRLTLRQALDMAQTHYRAGRLGEAESMFRQVAQIAPNEAEALHHLGLIAGRRAQFDEAVQWMRRCVAASPKSLEYQRDLGMALSDARKYDEAAEIFQKVVGAMGYLPEAYTTIANCYLNDQKVADAIEWFGKELAVNPASAVAWSNLGLAQAMMGQITDAVESYRRAVQLRPDLPAIHSYMLMLLQYDPSSTIESLRAEHRVWAERHAAPLAHEIRPHANDRTPVGSGGRRLRVGYVSSDLRRHVNGWSMLPILTHHDRGQFEVYCYSDVAHADETTAALRGHTDVWRDTWSLSHPQLAEQIRQDKIDILVDLQLHSSANRMLVFARKPAPVQVTYLGYAASTGLPTMDYRLTDPYMNPPGEPSDGPEELLRLSTCYWAYRPAIPTLDVGPPPFQSNGFVTFGSFNNYWKVHPGVVDAWAEILKRVPDARLIVIVHEGEKNAFVRGQFDAHGIERERVRLLPQQGLEDYFRRYGEADIALDSFPYNGGITTLNSLWMGVPLVTLSGSRAVGRGSRSILSNVGLADLAAWETQEYVRIAADLAADRPRLVELRETLRERLRRSPLMDEQRFTRDLEARYREIWDRWRVGAPTASPSP